MTVRLALAVAAGLLAASAVAGGAPPGPDLGQPSPALERMFTPLSVPPGTYRVTTTPRAIGDLAAALKAGDGAAATGRWAVEWLESHDAFGQAGVYDRFALAQLFGGTRAAVIRGARVEEGRRVAYTLISPYPDPSFTRLDAGTMVIRLRLEP